MKFVHALPLAVCFSLAAPALFASPSVRIRTGDPEVLSLRGGEQDAKECKNPAKCSRYTYAGNCHYCANSTENPYRCVPSHIDDCPPVSTGTICGDYMQCQVDPGPVCIWTDCAAAGPCTDADCH